MNAFLLQLSTVSIRRHTVPPSALLGNDGLSTWNDFVRLFDQLSGQVAEDCRIQNPVERIKRL
jgi:hypothetical protein